MNIEGNIPGPNMISVGMSMDEAADRIFAGSSDIINSTADYHAGLYGTYGTDYYGFYGFPEAENSGSRSVYLLEYSVPGSSGGSVVLTMTFDANKIMTSYTVSIGNKW